jgi:hypothetical protein
MQILTRKCYCAPYPHYHFRHYIRLAVIIGHIYNLVLHLQGNLLAVGTREGDVHVYDAAVKRLV